MTGISAADLREALRHVRDAFTEAEPRLNEADAKLGDGDTGTMLKRMAGKLSETDIDGVADLGAAFRTLALAASESTGSSLGTLVMTGLMSFARGTAGATTLAPALLAPLVAAATDDMQARGKAERGDKTIIDGLWAVREALAAAPPDQTAEAASEAAQSALEQFRPEPNRIGRAGRYGEKSRGLDDPGMLALHVLCEALRRREPL